MDQRDNSDAIEDVSRLNNQNKPLILADIEFEASDDHSQDLFNDCESSVQDSPSINFDLSEKVAKTIDTPRTANLLAFLTETPKFGTRNSYPDHPTVPTIPTSLVPFISTVNESWTSELETPQAETVGGGLSTSCEIVERKGCGAVRSSGVIPDMTTPNGCFAAEMESEGLSTSPILKKRRRPKRRILKSLIDPSISIDTSTDFANICHTSTDNYAGKEIQDLGPELTQETSEEHNSSPIDDTTFVIDANSSIHNSSVRLNQDEINHGDINSPREVQFMRDSTQDSMLNENDGEDCLMNQRLQSCEDFGETSLNATLKNEEEGVPSPKNGNNVIMDSVNDELLENKADGKSLAERVREIRELKETNMAEYKFADIPMDVFTRDAKALQSAEFIPQTPSSRSTKKKQWGLMSFTEMCLLEKEIGENQDLDFKETNDMDSTIKSHELSRNLKDDKGIAVKSETPTAEDDEDLVEIFASSFNDKETEPVIEFDEFSPWFYQSDGTESQSLTDPNTGGNIDKQKIGSEETERQKNLVNHLNSHKVKHKENICTDLPCQPPLCNSIGFSTASGRPLRVDEDMLKAATKLYNEIPLQDGKQYAVKMLSEIQMDQQINSRENERTIFNNSSGLMGFSTANGKPLKISEDKLNAATKSYNEIRIQVGKEHDAKMLPGIQNNEQMTNKENVPTIFKNSSGLMGFSTASGKPLKISEDKLKAATKSYNEIRIQVGKEYNTKMMPGVQKNAQMNNKDNESTIFKNSSGSIGFSTASGKPLKISEDKLKAATKSYNEIRIQVGKDYDAKMMPGDQKNAQMNNKDNESTISKNSSGLMGFSTASGKPLKISEDKLKAATKSYNEIRIQVGEDYDAKILPGIQNNEQMSNKENKTTIFKNSSGLMGFATAGGKPININENKLKEAVKLYEEVKSMDIPQSPFGSLKVPKFRGIKRRHESCSTDSYEKLDGNSSVGFTATSGKPLTVSESPMKKAKMIYQSKDIVDSHKPDDDCSTKQFINSEDLQKSDSRIKNYTEICEEGIKSTNKFSLATKDTNNVEIRESPMPIARNSLNNEKTLKSSKISNKVNKLTNTISDIQRSEQLTSSKIQSEIILQDFETMANKMLPGFSTASGKAIEISEQALASTKIKFAEEDHVASTRYAVEFSTANNQPLKISGDALVKSKKFFAIEQENTPPHYSLLKQSSTASETPADSSVSASKTPALKPSSENMLSEDVTPVLTKKARYNPDLLARKLFTENEGDSDEETEYPDKTSKDNNKGSRTPLSSNITYACRLLGHDRKKTVSFIENNPAGMYAKSEMFETNDRLMTPKLEPQRTWPSNENIDTAQYAQRSSIGDNVKSVQARKDRKISIVSDEITASTEAFLADEENSLNARSWASAITCSPTMIQDRDISAQPMTIGTGCGDDVREVPTSPIIGGKIRSRKKLKRNKRNTFKKDVLNLKTTKDNGYNNNEYLEEHGVTQDSQQSSSVATPSSDSSKESHRITSPAIGAALVSKLEKLVESPPKFQFGNNQSDVEIQLTPTETEIGEEEMENFLENRIAATLEQEKIIRAKKRCKPKPIPGSLYLRKTENKQLRISWQRVADGSAPTPKTACELAKLGIQLNVMEVTAATALRYKFKCSNFYSKDQLYSSVCGLEMIDGGRLIVDENGCAGVAEFEQAFLASPGVDPNLLHERWVENHYRWIVWKLAAMDRMKFGDLSLRRMLTPRNVMEQLKYRYDREIDESQRPALRKIIEKDEPASRRIVLCVATITKPENIQASDKSPKMPSISHWRVELTDGWYGLTATIDSSMAHLIACGKVQEGTKLLTSRAELLNCDQGCFPLDMLSDVSLKIHTNSTRRSKWDAKLGFCKYACPVPTSLSAILLNGGLIGKLDTTIARVYPIQYFEKNWSGQSIFRNSKCEDKAVIMYEREREAQIDKIFAQTQAEFEARSRKSSKRNDDDPDSYQEKKPQRFNSYDESLQEAFQNELQSALRNNLPPPRKVTVVLKVRVMDGENLAILTLWAPSEDIIDVLKEGNRVSIHNVQTSGKRLGEVQLTAGRQSFVKPERSIISSFPQRCLTSIPEVAVLGFNPPFGEFDTVGIVVSLGPAPHGMKNFEAVNLAYPNPDTPSSAYLSILFWEGIGAHGFSDILTVGSTVACTNLQWRRGAPRPIPIAYSTEHSTFTRNPRQVYLRSDFDWVKNQITDAVSYTSQCAAEIAIEHQKRSNILRSPAVQGCMSSPCAGFPQDKFAAGVSPRTPQGLINSEKNTPAKSSIQQRLEKLQWYAEPPDLSPVVLNHSSSRFKQDFVLPVRTPEH